jgi:hypothetical protein
MEPGLGIRSWVQSSETPMGHANEPAQLGSGPLTYVGGGRRSHWDPFREQTEFPLMSSLLFRDALICDGSASLSSHPFTGQVHDLEDSQCGCLPLELCRLDFGGRISGVDWFPSAKAHNVSTKLSLPGSTNLPANAETLYHALIRAGEQGEILGEASLTGLYSSTPPAN